VIVVEDRIVWEWVFQPSYLDLLKKEERRDIGVIVADKLGLL
jgi:hypothetical protein